MRTPGPISPTGAEMKRARHHKLASSTSWPLAEKTRAGGPLLPQQVATLRHSMDPDAAGGHRSSSCHYNVLWPDGDAAAQQHWRRGDRKHNGDRRREGRILRFDFASRRKEREWRKDGYDWWVLRVDEKKIEKEEDEGKRDGCGTVPILKNFNNTATNRRIVVAFM